jgi:hypothetical protein
MWSGYRHMKKLIAIAFGVGLLAAAPVAANDLGKTLNDISGHVRMLTLDVASPSEGSVGGNDGIENEFDPAVVPLPAAGFLLLGGLGGLALLRRRTRA